MFNVQSLKNLILFYNEKISMLLPAMGETVKHYIGHDFLQATDVAYLRKFINKQIDIARHIKPFVIAQQLVEKLLILQQLIEAFTHNQLQPIASLPPEILVDIFSRLDKPQDLAHVMLSTQVFLRAAITALEQKDLAYRQACHVAVQEDSITRNKMLFHGLIPPVLVLEALENLFLLEIKSLYAILSLDGSKALLCLSATDSSPTNVALGVWDLINGERLICYEVNSWISFPRTMANQLEENTNLFEALKASVNTCMHWKFVTMSHDGMFAYVTDKGVKRINIQHSSRLKPGSLLEPIYSFEIPASYTNCLALAFLTLADNRYVIASLWGDTLFVCDSQGPAIRRSPISIKVRENVRFNEVEKFPSLIISPDGTHLAIIAHKSQSYAAINYSLLQLIALNQTTSVVTKDWMPQMRLSCFSPCGRYILSYWDDDHVSKARFYLLDLTGKIIWQHAYSNNHTRFGRNSNAVLTTGFLGKQIMLLYQQTHSTGAVKITRELFPLPDLNILPYPVMDIFPLSFGSVFSTVTLLQLSQQEIMQVEVSLSADNCKALLWSSEGITLQGFVKAFGIWDLCRGNRIVDYSQKLGLGHVPLTIANKLQPWLAEDARLFMPPAADPRFPKNIGYLTIDAEGIIAYIALLDDRNEIRVLNNDLETIGHFPLNKSRPRYAKKIILLPFPNARKKHYLVISLWWSEKVETAIIFVVNISNDKNSMKNIFVPPPAQYKIKFYLDTSASFIVSPDGSLAAIINSEVGEMVGSLQYCRILQLVNLNTGNIVTEALVETLVPRIELCAFSACGRYILAYCRLKVVGDLQKAEVYLFNTQGKIIWQYAYERQRPATIEMLAASFYSPTQILVIYKEINASGIAAIIRDIKMLGFM